jgi:hypothetical protein
MDMSKMPTDTNGVFPFVDLFARVESETESSVSLTLGRFTNRPSDCPPETEWFFDSCGPASFFQSLGWIDLHYPCKGHRKALIRMDLPSEFHDPDRLAGIIQALFELFSIPRDAAYVAYYFTVDNLRCIVPTDEFGRG